MSRAATPTPVTPPAVVVTAGGVARLAQAGHVAATGRAEAHDGA